MDLFIAKYFLDGLHGKPYSEKTKEPLILQCVDHRLFERIASSIPGLAVEGDNSITVIGWKDNIKPGLDMAFALLSSSSEGPSFMTTEANYDLGRFIAK